MHSKFNKRFHSLLIVIVNVNITMIEIVITVLKKQWVFKLNIDYGCLTVFKQTLGDLKQAHTMDD